MVGDLPFLLPPVNTPAPPEGERRVWLTRIASHPQKKLRMQLFYVLPLVVTLTISGKNSVASIWADNVDWAKPNKTLDCRSPELHEATVVPFLIYSPASVRAADGRGR